MAKLDWVKLEDAYVKEAIREVKKLMRDHPDETFYAVALHESYRETEHVITLPLLAVNTFEAIEHHEKGRDYGEYCKWSSPDWWWIHIKPSSRIIRQQDEALQDEANCGTESYWFKVEKLFVASMVRVAKRLYAELKIHRQTSSDFVVYFDDEDGGHKLIKKCMPKRLFVKHFGDPEAAINGLELAVAEVCSKHRLEALWGIGVGGQDENSIVQIGVDAADFLVDKVKQRDETGWIAARCLTRIGVCGKEGVGVLREEVREQTEASMWSAKALGMIGDFNFLMEMADQDETRRDAVSGITAPLRIRPESYDPLDYRPLQRLLKKKNRKINACVAKELEPGVGYRDIMQGDVEEAIRGLNSTYLSIRQHAVCVLGDRSLGQSKHRGVGKMMADMILPELVKSLENKHPNVRRLAILSIGRWESMARPYKSDVQKLSKDKDPEIRRTVKYVIGGDGFF